MARRSFHLVRRFFEVLRARPLDDTELSAVRSWVGDDLMAIFITQQTADQRHGYQIAHGVYELTASTELAAAAALHDVGKRHSDFGAVGRTLATVLMALRLPLGGRLRAYRDHGELGAADLEAVGAPLLVVEFARHHQHRRPPSIDVDDWSVLNGADLGALPKRRT
jgi:hypothetical protein